MEAVEFSPILAEHARTALGIEVSVARAWDLSALRGDRFDAIFSQNLEHVPDPGVMLAQCRELLAPDGWLMLEVPNQFHSLIDVLKLAVPRIAGDGAYSWFIRDIAFESYALLHTSTGARSESARDSRCSWWHASRPAPYPAKDRARAPGPTTPGGGNRGPCIEVIAAGPADDTD